MPGRPRISPLFPSTPLFQSTGKPAWWLPLLGAALGAAGAGIYLLTLRSLPPSLAAFACVVFWTAAGRIPHEGQPPYAAIALGAAAKWLALDHVIPDHLGGSNLLFVCIAAQAVPRSAMVGLAWVSRPVIERDRSEEHTSE